MAIKIGNLDISAFKVGSGDCTVYLGDTLLYPTTPPTFQGKWEATYDGGSVTSASCDASSAITQNEISLSNLVEVEIGDCVTSINGWVFDSCGSLSSCTIGSSVTTIGESAFYGCSSLTSITIPNSVTSIGDYALASTNIRNIDIPSGVTSLYGTFQGCSNLTSITLSSGLTYIGGSTFSETRIASIDIPTGVTTIGYYAFQNCSYLTNIVIPNGVTRIEENTFEGCGSLTSITLSSGLTYIGDDAFAYCTSLTSITIPSGVTSFGSSAFAYCGNLNSVTCLATTPPSGVYNTFDGTSSNLKIYVPSGSVEDYKAAWSEYEDRITAIPNS